MAPPTIQHRRLHNLLLISKLLNQRDAISPFTLVLDSLEQSSRPLLLEYVTRAHSNAAIVVFLSFETIRRPAGVDHFLPAWQHTTKQWQQAVADVQKAHKTQRMLIICDSLNGLAALKDVNLPALLFSLIGSPTTSLIGVYHTDVPQAHFETNSYEAYLPSPLSTLRYISTTIFTTHCAQQVFQRKAARDRSLAEPSYGLELGIDGILQGIESNGTDGIVLEMEHRRKSGRVVQELYHLTRARITQNVPLGMKKSRDNIILLEDHPQYQAVVTGRDDGQMAESQGTFELGLTEKQRRDREGVVLPYFDAQNGGGEGGRILYDMGEEDDFDEDEDEI